MRPASLRQPRGSAALIATLAALAAIDVLAHVPVVVRAPAGLLLVLVLPGWPWLLLGQRQRRTLETAALIVAASLGITMVTGLILDVLPCHLTRSSWSLGLFAATLLGSAVLWLRSSRLPSALTTSRGGPRPASWSVRQLALLGAGSLMLLALLAVIAVVSVESQHASYRQEHFTVLSLNATSPDVLAVEVVDHEEAAVEYRVTAISQGKQVFVRRFVLGAGKAVTVRVRVPADTVLLDARLQIRLYRAGRADPYRSLSLTPHEGRWL
jgi:hypothetical protein